MRLPLAALLAAMLTAPCARAQRTAGCQCADGSANPSCDRNVCCIRMTGHSCDDGGGAAGALMGAGAASIEDQMALGVAGMAISSFINGIFSQQTYPDPHKEAQRQRIIELERAQAAERDKARRRKFIKDRDELLAELKGRKFIQDLKFKRLGGTPRPVPGQGGHELEERRQALKRLKGKPEENWCAEHFSSLLCPARPTYEMGKLYESRLAAYRAAKKDWDAKCAGPSSRPDYRDRDGCGDAPGPTPESLDIQARALDCAMGEIYRAAEAMGPKGGEYAAELRRDMEEAKKRLPRENPGGDAHDIVNFSRDLVEGDAQLVTRMLISRERKTGKTLIDVAYSITRPGLKEQTGQNIALVSPSGSIESRETTSAAAKCLETAKK